jgi:outer membrane receptor protein involved in Fe transport
VFRLAPQTFDPHDLGADVYSYQPHVGVFIVSGNGFQVNNPGPSRFTMNASQIGDDLTVVRGDHQMSVGGSLAYWQFHFLSHARSGGNWTFSGQATGLGLADFLVGRVGRLEHGGPAILPMEEWYAGLYAQDAWRATSRVTINAGLRWEPYVGQNVLNGSVYNFNLDNYRKNVRTKVYANAPAGLIYPGDEGFPPGRSGLNKQWFNFSPRIGLALGRERYRPHRGTGVLRPYV